MVGSWYKLPGPHSVAYVSAFLGSITTCPIYKLTLSDQAQITLATNSQSLGFSDKILKRSALTGGVQKMFFTRPESTLGGPV